MTPPRSSDQSEGFRAKNRPSLTTYASIVRPAAEFVYGLTIRADPRDGCSATSTEGSNRPLDDVWFAGCGKCATTVAGHGKSIPGKANGNDPLLKTLGRLPAGLWRPRGSRKAAREADSLARESLIVLDQVNWGPNT